MTIAERETVRQATDTMDELVAERDRLAARVAELEARPCPEQVARERWASWAHLRMTGWRDQPSGWPGVEW